MHVNVPAVKESDRSTRRPRAGCLRAPERITRVTRNVRAEMTRLRGHVRVLVVVSLVVLAGCSALPGLGDSEDATSGASVPDGDVAASSYATIGNVTGTLHVETVRGNVSRTASFRFAADVGTRSVRQRVTAGSHSEGNLFVSNDDVYWRYNASRDVAAKYPHGPGTFTSTFGTRNQSFGEFLQSAFEAASSDGDGTVSNLPNVGVGPAPTVSVRTANDAGGTDDDSSGADGDDFATANVSEYTVSYDGTTTVNGRDAHVLVVQPASGNASSTISNRTITYHVDAETLFPLKITRTATVEGDAWRHVMTFTNLEYGPDLPADTYTYEPNASTQVVDYTTGVVPFSNRDALASNVSVPLPEPEVPSGFAFRNGAAIELNTSGAQVVYTNGSAALIAGRYVDDGVIRPVERRLGENRTIDGNRALVVESGNQKVVYVYCGEYVTSAASIGSIPIDVLLEFSASFACTPGDESEHREPVWEPGIDLDSLERAIDPDLEPIVD